MNTQTLVKDNDIPDAKNFILFKTVSSQKEVRVDGTEHALEYDSEVHHKEFSTLMGARETIYSPQENEEEKHDLRQIMLARVIDIFENQEGK